VISAQALAACLVAVMYLVLWGLAIAVLHQHREQAIGYGLLTMCVVGPVVALQAC
jgi:hypothetical protein